MDEKSFDALRIIEAAKEVERRGIAFYREAADVATDQGAKDMLLALMNDEAGHLKYLEKWEGGLEKAFPNLKPGKGIGDLATRFKDALFPEEPSQIRFDTGKLNEIQALERGIELEEESIRIYEDAAEREVNPGARSAFRGLVMEERLHLFILNQRRDLLKMRV